MDYETYKTNSSECFKWIKTQALEKMDVIWVPYFKVGSIIFFHNIGFRL